MLKFWDKVYGNESFKKTQGDTLLYGRGSTSGPSWGVTRVSHWQPTMQGRNLRSSYEMLTGLQRTMIKGNQDADKEGLQDWLAYTIINWETGEYPFLT